MQSIIYFFTYLSFTFHDVREASKVSMERGLEVKVSGHAGFVERWVGKWRERSPSLVQFILFGLVGATGVVVDYAVLVPLTELAGWDPRAAAVVSFTVAVTWNYWLNRKITFAVGREVEVMGSYVIFLLVCLVGLGVRILVMHVSMTYLGMGTGRWYLMASLLGIGAATMVNFLGSKFWAFKAR